MVNDSTQLCGLLGRIVLQPWSETSIKALGILCGCDPNLHSSVILLLFPQFLLCSLDDLSFLRSLCETNIAKSNQVIKAVAQKLKKKALSNKKLTAEEIAEISIEVTEWLAAAVMKMPDHNEFLTQLSERADSTRYKCQFALFLNAAIPLMTNQKDKIQWCGKQLRLLHQLQPEGQKKSNWEEVIAMVTNTCQSLELHQTQGNAISLNLLGNLIQLIPDQFKDHECKYLKL